MSDVDPEGPSDQAGLKRGDVIVSADGITVRTAHQFETAIYYRAPGDPVHLVVMREQAELQMTPILQERVRGVGRLTRITDPEKNLIRRLGVLCVPIDKDIAAVVPGLRREYGLIVAARISNGQSHSIDLKVDDIIDAVNRFPVTSIESLRSILDTMKPGDPVVLQIQRDSRFRYVTLEVDH